MFLLYTGFTVVNCPEGMVIYMEFKKIGVLTSGGDAPGMNAVIRAVVRTAGKAGVETVGIMEGYQGLMDGNFVELNSESVSNVISKGGTMLYTARAAEFKEKSGMEKALKVCRENNIDGIIAIGGDGTFRGATELSENGIPTIGLTGTIDNDITATDYTVGFDTAMNAVIDCVDRLRDTCESHARCIVVEVMGRDAGYIALQAGVATGAIGIVIKEVPFDESAMIERIIKSKAEGRRSFVVMVAEGVKDAEGKPYGEGLTLRIEQNTGVESRFNRLAHIIRGGSPTLRDRLAASMMGEAAVKLLLDGKSNLVVCERNAKIVTFEINFALTLDKMYKNKLKPGDLDRFSHSEIKDMEVLAEIRRQEIRDMYNAALSLM